MPDRDPVLEAWAEARRAQEHPLSFTQVAVAAYNGLLGLEEAQRAHLVRTRCERCEGILLEAWEGRRPPADLAREARGWGADGALGHALRAHLATRPAGESPELRAAVAPAAAAPAEPSRARRALESLGASFAVAFRPRLVGVVNDPDPGVAPAPRSVVEFGPAVRIAAVPPDGARIVVDFGLLPELRGRDVVVVLQRRGSDEILAETRFENATGRASADLRLPPAVLQEAALELVLGVRA